MISLIGSSPLPSAVPVFGQTRGDAPLTDLLIAIVGWAGAVIILAAYVLLSLERLPARSATYQWLNVAGAACFVINSGWHGALPPAALNVVWAGIGLFALVRMARARAVGREEPPRQ